MKTLLITLAMIITTGAAQADGFRCITDSGLNIQVYNHTSAELGTRSGAMMVISDANVGLGNKTIASFSAEKKTLTSHELTYFAKVDLRVVESRRKGENIGGTKLGQLEQIILAVDFTYAQPMLSGERTAGLLTLVKRNGEELVEDATCTRYLKN